MKNAYKKVRGFTIVEILVVLAIISLLSSIVMVSVGSARENSKNKELKLQRLHSLNFILNSTENRRTAIPLVYEEPI